LFFFFKTPRGSHSRKQEERQGVKEKSSEKERKEAQTAVTNGTEECRQQAHGRKILRGRNPKHERPSVTETEGSQHHSTPHCDDVMGT